MFFPYTFKSFFHSPLLLFCLSSFLLLPLLSHALQMWISLPGWERVALTVQSMPLSPGVVWPCVYDGEAVSSSYESYDEEEVSRGKSPSAQHQWPSAEASIELMKDARICAFLWRKKWLGQWGKQLCVIKDHRLLCYKSSKEQTPLLDVSLLGCTVVYKEKLLKRKEHKLKIIPFGGEAIVLGLQSKEQTEQWLKVGVFQDSHTETSEIKDGECDFVEFCSSELKRHHIFTQSRSFNFKVMPPFLFLSRSIVKKKYGAGLKFSNLMNIGKKKNLFSTSSVTSSVFLGFLAGYLNVLVNSQWRTCWCLIKNGQLWFYQDKGKNKVSQPAVKLEGCSVAPDPNPERLYSFRIDMEGTQLATLEAKTSADMGHWLGLLLSLTGTKTDPEELTYDYVNADRISCIVNAAKTSFYYFTKYWLLITMISSYLPLFTGSPGSVEVKLGKNRTEADMRRYIDELQHLEKEREEVRSSLGKLKKERKETKEELSACQDPQQQLTLEACLKQKEEACREAENHRVEVELQLVEVKESLKKVEAGPFTLGTTSCAEAASPVNSASALKNRPASVMTTKGTVLQKAKVRFHI
uniref:Actin filament-associated protein 1-like 2 n=1 Tax=Gouania willdenowi TaxID=441366 RepID=A0A8C5HP37_GOUWI